MKYGVCVLAWALMQEEHLHCCQPVCCLFVFLFVVYVVTQTRWFKYNTSWSDDIVSLFGGGASSQVARQLLQECRH